MAAKRKHTGKDSKSSSRPALKVAKTATPPPQPQPEPVNPDSTIHIQLVAGTYEKILHGFIASIPVSALSSQSKSSNATELELKTTFIDTFLFTAHTAPLRCLAISPSTDSTADPKSVNNQSATPLTSTKTHKRILATGSPDEKINLYTLSSTIAPIKPTVCNNDFNIPSAAPTQSGSNRHLGALHEHTNTVTRILFTPSRNKMISTGEDNKILIWKTRDWSLLSEIKAPKPKTTTASLGGIGSGGVYDIALHPSQKILFSVAKGERCLRMWNMMTGKKAGVLGWTKDQVDVKLGGAVRDGRKILWSGDGTLFVVGFERGALVYGMNSEPIVKILPNSKVTQMRFLPVPPSFTPTSAPEVLAISTEDGRITFYTLPSPAPTTTTTTSDDDEDEKPIPTLPPTGEIGGPKVGMVTRIKDFTTTTLTSPPCTLLSTASSDGTVRIWLLDPLAAAANSILALNTSSSSTTTIPTIPETENISEAEKAQMQKEADQSKAERESVGQWGKLLGIYETGRRITCLDGMRVETDVDYVEEEGGDVSMGESSEEEEDE